MNPCISHHDSTVQSAIEKFEGPNITNDMLVAAAKLFTGNYGVWGPLAKSKMGSFANPGARIKMSAKTLKEQVLSEEGHNIYIRLMVDGNLVANLIAVRWVYQDRRIVWVTQLCVSKDYRNQGIAKRLLEKLRCKEIDQSLGILSSQPFAIAAVLSVFGEE